MLEPGELLSPAGQSLQETEPALLEYLPAAHLLQVLEPALLEYLPATQSAHELRPEPLFFPAAHDLQLLPPVEYVPAAHLLQVLEPGELLSPAGQSLQEPEPALLEYLPDAQFLHPVLPFPF